MSANIKHYYALDYWIEEEERGKYWGNRYQYFNPHFMKYNSEFIKSQNYNCLLYNWSFKEKNNILKAEGQLQNDNYWETSTIRKIDIISSDFYSPLDKKNVSNNYLKIITASNHNYMLPIHGFQPEKNIISLYPDKQKKKIFDNSLKIMNFDLENWCLKKKKGLYNVTGFYGEEKIISSPIRCCIFEKDVLLLTTVNNYLYSLDYHKIKGGKTYFKF